MGEFEAFEFFRKQVLDPSSVLKGAQLLPNLYVPNADRDIDSGGSPWSQVDLVIATKSCAFVVETKRKYAIIVAKEPYEEVLSGVSDRDGTITMCPWNAGLSQNSQHAVDFSRVCETYPFERIFELLLLVGTRSFSSGGTRFIKNVYVGGLPDGRDQLLEAMGDACAGSTELPSDDDPRGLVGHRQASPIHQIDDIRTYDDLLMVRCNTRPEYEFVKIWTCINERRMTRGAFIQMTAENPQDFDYERMTEPSDASTRRGYWGIAKGLQKVDGLETSAYLDEVAARHIAGEYSIADAGSVIRAYYADKGTRHEGDGFDSAVETGETNEAEQREKRDISQLREQEADIVSCRIVELLGRRAFDLSPAVMSSIHWTLFQDLDPEVYQPGVYKTDMLVKSEFILNGDSVLYADPSLVVQSLTYLFDRERNYLYGLEFDVPQIAHLSEFVAHLWQIHPFVEGNTRTVAVFCALYLNFLGFDIDDEPFEKHARYFRDALVRANYRNAKAGILPNLEYLERFFENMLDGADHDLHSRDMICRPLFDDPALLRNVDPQWAIEKR